jgi:hypothetical protein
MMMTLARLFVRSLLAVVMFALAFSALTVISLIAMCADKWPLHHGEV